MNRHNEVNQAAALALAIVVLAITVLGILGFYRALPPVQPSSHMSAATADRQVLAIARGTGPFDFDIPFVTSAACPEMTLDVGNHYVCVLDDSQGYLLTATVTIETNGVLGVDIAPQDMP